MEKTLKEIVMEAGAREEVRRAVGEIYAELQKEIEIRKPVCVTSGRCCRFEEFGHRLYVTTVELAVFWHELQRQGDGVKQQQANGGCPFQVGKSCGVHGIRPFGCRVFFCDVTAEQWQKEVYERFHGRLKGLHEKLKVPYRYLEWRAALQVTSV